MVTSRRTRRSGLWVVVTAIALVVLTGCNGPLLLLSWGANSSGQVGDGAIHDRPTTSVRTSTPTGPWSRRATRTPWPSATTARCGVGGRTTTTSSRTVADSQTGARPDRHLDLEGGGRGEAISSGHPQRRHAVGLGLRILRGGRLWPGRLSTHRGRSARPPTGRACTPAPRCGAAIRSDGTLWTWGADVGGQIGIGSNHGAIGAAPVQVGTATNWKSVSIGGGFMLALRTDGTLWAWGSDAQGERG